MKNRVLVLGYFGYLNNQLDGQTVKTRNIYKLLQLKSKDIGLIDYFDTQQFQKSKLSIVLMIRKIWLCNKLVYIPAHRNLKYIFPFIFLIGRLKSIDLLYFVVGGWLPEYLKSKRLHVAMLSKIQCIFIESDQLRDKLIQLYHFKNVTTFPNFRLHSFSPSFKQNLDSFRIVFMARIRLMKGIDIVFRLAEYIRNKYESNHTIIIDFYGPIEKDDEAYFSGQLKNYSFVSYMGIIEPEQVYGILDQYDLLVLPTRYSSEGFPGTILDAYISGLPVIASNWNYSLEFIDDGETGFVFDVMNEEEFHIKVDKLYRDPGLLQKMKRNAYEKSKSYSTDIVWNIIKGSLAS